MQDIFKITISSMDLSQPEQIILQVEYNPGLDNLSSKNRLRDRFSGSKFRQVPGQGFSGPSFREESRTGF